MHEIQGRSIEDRTEAEINDLDIYFGSLRFLELHTYTTYSPVNVSLSNYSDHALWPRKGLLRPNQDK